MGRCSNFRTIPCQADIWAAPELTWLRGQRDQHQLLSCHRHVANRGAAAAVPLLHTNNSLEGKIKIKYWAFCWDRCSPFPFCNPNSHGNGSAKSSSLPRSTWMERPGSKCWGIGGIFTEAEAKFKGGTALCTLCSQTVSKEKSRFQKRSDLFDDFVISVLELRLFYMCFK